MHYHLANKFNLKYMEIKKLNSYKKFFITKAAKVAYYVKILKR